MRSGHAEDRQQSVARDVGDDAAEAVDRFAERLQATVDERGDLLGVERFGDTREAGQIGEQHGRPTPLLDWPRGHRGHFVVEWRPAASAEPELEWVGVAAGAAGLPQGSAAHAAEALIGRVQLAAALTSRGVGHRCATLSPGVSREEHSMAGPQRISYVALDEMTPEMQAEMERCAREGTPRPESSAVRAHVPAAFWSFANSWRDIFHTGVCDHAIKELARLYVSRAVNCEFCGNQRSIQAAEAGRVDEAKVDDLIDFEKSTKYEIG